MPDKPTADVRLDDIELEAPELSDEELIEQLEFESRQNAEVEELAYFPDVPEASGPLAVWPADADSMDYAHLVGTPDGTDFTLDHDALARLVRLNHFELADSDLVVFGLRGCLVNAPSTDGFVDAVPCTETRPDHVQTKCAIGLWRRSTKQIAVFTGSTVPDAVWLSGYVAGGINTNMLPTGVYRYTSGKHKKVQGALVMAQPKFYVARPKRPKAKVVIDNRDPFTGPRWVPDNIHPTYNPARGVEMNSAGCQTVKGTVRASTNTHYGQWAIFRRLGGFETEGRPYEYMLLTGREARLAADPAVADATLWRLRFGSSGPEVRELQQALGAGVDGDFGSGTADKVVAWQRAHQGGRADGIVASPGALGVA